MPHTVKLPFVVFATLVAFSGLASAQAPLLNDLGGPAGFGDNMLEYNDDSSSSSIDMTPAFPNGIEFFGQRYMSVFVNNNGNITFGGSTRGYTPQRFPLSGNRMIAPFWGDVDTSAGGRPSRNGVYWHLSPGRMVITWHNVGYYSSRNDRENTFQLVIESNAMLDEDHIWRVEFRYNRCEWTTGSASGGQGGLGGQPAQAGFDAGDGSTYRILPGSGTNSVLNLCRLSNVDVAGVWVFNVHNGMPQVDQGSGEGGAEGGSVGGGEGSPEPSPRPSRRRSRRR